MLWDSLLALFNSLWVSGRGDFSHVNIKEAEIAFKTTFWSSLLKVILFFIVIKIETEGSLLVQIRHSPFI